MASSTISADFGCGGCLWQLDFEFFGTEIDLGFKAGMGQVQRKQFWAWAWSNKNKPNLFSFIFVFLFLLFLFFFFFWFDPVPLSCFFLFIILFLFFFLFLLSSTKQEIQMEAVPVGIESSTGWEERTHWLVVAERRGSGRNGIACGQRFDGEALWLGDATERKKCSWVWQRRARSRSEDRWRHEFTDAGHR